MYAAVARVEPRCPFLINIRRFNSTHPFATAATEGDKVNRASKSGAAVEHVNRKNECIQKTKPSKCKKGEFQCDKEKAVSQQWTKVKPLDLNFPQ